MNFTQESFYNAHLALGTKRLDVIMTVTGSGGGGVAVPQGKKAVALIIDNSGSMSGEKLQTARTAARQCIEQLDEQSYFTVIAFNSSPEVVTPLSLASSQAKHLAHERIKRISATGGTEMSKALIKTRDELAKAGQAISVALFVTDGENGEDSTVLDRALTQCEGKYQCFCWGIGTDWKPDDLRRISGRLLGSADAVPDPNNLEAHFRGTLNQTMSKGIREVKLRLQITKSCRIVGIKQMSPEIVDLSKLTKKIDEKVSDIPLGAWGDEARDYHMVFEIDPQADGEQLMVCKPKVVYDEGNGEVEVEGKRIIVGWSSDGTLTTRINAQVAHYTGQAELASSIREGLEAKARGDVDQATALLGRAAKIAVETGNEEVTQRIKKVVDIVDAHQGTVRLRAGASKGDDLELDMGGTRTVRRKGGTNH